MRLALPVLQVQLAQPARLVLMARKAYRVTLVLPALPDPLGRQARPVHKAILVLRAQLGLPAQRGRLGRRETPVLLARLVRPERLVPRVQPDHKATQDPRAQPGQLDPQAHPSP